MGNNLRLSICISAIILISPINLQAGVWRGMGGDSCGSFLKASTGHRIAQARKMTWEGSTYYDEAGAYSEWIQGYLTGISVEMNVSVLDAVDYAGIDLWLRKWCDKHPTENILTGLKALVEEKSKPQ